MKLPRLWQRERLVTIQQFLDKDRRLHIYIVTNKRVAEVDYSGKEKRTIATLKELKALVNAFKQLHNLPY